MRQYIDLVQDNNGNAIVGATVTVKDYPSLALASIYSDNGLTPIANSVVTTDGTGAFAFFVADGDYALEFRVNGNLLKTQSPVSMFDGAAQLTVTDTGTTNAYKIVDTALEKALRTGLRCFMAATSSNTGAATLQYNNLVAKAIVLPDGTALPSGTLTAGGRYMFEYNGTSWQLIVSSTAPNWPLTALESALSVTPTTLTFPPGDPRRAPTLYTNPNWVDYGDSGTFLSNTSFRIPSVDRSARYPFASYLKLLGTGGTVFQCRVQAASFSGGNTDFTVAGDGGNVPNPILAIYRSQALLGDSPATVRWDYNLNSGSFHWNVNNGSSATAKVAVAVGVSGLGADCAVNLVACGSAYGAYIPNSGVTGKQVWLQTGLAIPIGLATNDVMRELIPGTVAQPIRFYGSSESLAIISPRESDSLGGAWMSFYKSVAQGGQRKGYFGFSDDGSINTFNITNEVASSNVKVTATGSIWLCPATTGVVYFDNAANVFIKYGSGSPEGVVTGNPGCLFMRSDGGASTTLYVKTSGSGNTGWTAK